jgi:hypothetical protein
MTHCQDKVAARVCFLRTATIDMKSAETDNWREAARIPGVQVQCDDDGLEARQFGVETSGDTVLYAPTGQLLFHGGITISRGHAGDNPGREAIEALLSGGAARTTSTPAFGCSLFRRPLKDEKGID